MKLYCKNELFAHLVGGFVSLPKESCLHTQCSIQLLDYKTGDVSDFPSYLTIQERASQIIFIRQPYLHSSLNPLSGNSLY